MPSSHNTREQAAPLDRAAQQTIVLSQARGTSAMSQDAFEDVATALVGELKPFGLQPVKFEPAIIEDGYWAVIASWTGNRPDVALWFDRFLTDGPTHFWFGFQSTALRIKKLSAEVPEEFQHPAMIGDGDLRQNYSLTAEATRRVKQCGGLAYEQFKHDYHYFGKYDVGFPTTAGDLVTQAANFIVGIVQYIQPALAIELDLKELAKRRDVDKTTRKQLIDARRGQGKFRRDLLRLWGGCAINGCVINEVLRASHIKPWKDATDKERLNPSNGLLLTATLDALFDRGLITFDDDGVMLVSKRLAESQHLLLDKHRRTLRLKPLSDEQKAFLQHHRDDVFRRR